MKPIYAGLTNLRWSALFARVNAWLAFVPQRVGEESRRTLHWTNKYRLNQIVTCGATKTHWSRGAGSALWGASFTCLRSGWVERIAAIGTDFITLFYLFSIKIRWLYISVVCIGTVDDTFFIEDRVQRVNTANACTDVRTFTTSLASFGPSTSMSN